MRGRARALLLPAACASLACAPAPAPPPGQGTAAPSPAALAALHRDADTLNAAVVSIAEIMRSRVVPEPIASMPARLPATARLSFVTSAGEAPSVPPAPASGPTPHCPAVPRREEPEGVPRSPWWRVGTDEAIANEHAAMADQVSELEAVLPSRHDAARLERELRCPAECAGVELTDLAIAQPLASAHADVLETSVTFAATGTRAALDDFVQRLVHAPRAVTFDEVALASAPEGRVVARFRLRAFVHARS